MLYLVYNNEEEFEDIIELDSIIDLSKYEKSHPDVILKYIEEGDEEFEEIEVDDNLIDEDVDYLESTW